MATHDDYTDTVSDGDQLNDGYFNAIATQIRRKRVVDASEYTTSDSSYVGVTAFTITNPANAILLGVLYKADIHGAGSTGASNIEISSAAGTTAWIASVPNVDSTGHPTISTFNDTASLIGENGGTTATKAASAFTPFKLVDTTTTFTINLKETGAGAAVIFNIELDIIYAPAFSEE